jgi:hypothetical protein
LTAISSTTRTVNDTCTRTDALIGAACQPIAIVIKTDGQLATGVDVRNLYAMADGSVTATELLSAKGTATNRDVAITRDQVGHCTVAQCNVIAACQGAGAGANTDGDVIATRAVANTSVSADISVA